MKTRFERAEMTVSQCGRLLLAALLLFPSLALGQAQVLAKPLILRKQLRTAAGLLRASVGDPYLGIISALAVNRD